MSLYKLALYRMYAGENYRVFPQFSGTYFALYAVCAINST